MRLAIMQPYFFPYIGHFSLIAACDEWIVFDLSQYTPRSWMNRNRILDPAGSPRWLTLPLARASIHIRTHEARIPDLPAARRHILNHLAPHRRAPHYPTVTAIVDETFDTPDPSLARLNHRALAVICRHIGLPFRARIASDLGLHLPDRPGPGDWAPLIAAQLGATTYINPISGQALFNQARFAKHGIDLRFLQPRPFLYRSGRHGTHPNLSILDALLWCTPEHIRAAIADFTLHPPPFPPTAIDGHIPPPPHGPPHDHQTA